MSTESDQAARQARELEADLDAYPDERGQILIEAGESAHRAGDHDRAIELLTQASDLGGEDGGTALVALADVLFDLDRAEQAQAQLDTLRDQRLTSVAPYHLAAELLEYRGDYQQALTWFNMAVSRLSADDMATRDGPFAMFSYTNNVLAGRRRVRRTLDLPADELDDSIPESGQALFDRFDELLADHTPTPQRMQVLFWPRDEVVTAHQRWPGMVEHADIDTLIREREHTNRNLADSGVTHITMVPLTAARLTAFAERTGGDPTDEDTRLACMREIVQDGDVINWPPGRNAPCWCGSARKYKKCCGRPNTA